MGSDGDRVQPPPVCIGHGTVQQPKQRIGLVGDLAEENVRMDSRPPAGERVCEVFVVGYQRSIHPGLSSFVVYRDALKGGEGGKSRGESTCHHSRDCLPAVRVVSVSRAPDESDTRSRLISAAKRSLASSDAFLSVVSKHCCMTGGNYVRSGRLPVADSPPPHAEILGELVKGQA
jgi:hypothetical protein